jgi:SAM-dependent methyltransferase
MTWQSNFQQESLARPSITQPRITGKLASIKYAEPEDYYWLNGRRYVMGVPYMLPKDLKEVNRLNFEHYVAHYALKGSYIAPIREPTKILDVGYGTGKWMADMAAEFPGTQIVGVDLTPPALPTIPGNCSFQRGNILHGLPFKDKYFDFVHQRHLGSAVPVRKWPFIIKELERVTCPGGWVELTEYSPTMEHAGPGTMSVASWIEKACEHHNINARVALYLETMLRDAGFVNVSTREQALPVGSWGGRLGSMVATNLEALTQAFKPLTIRFLNVNPSTYDHTAAYGQAECEQLHTTMTLHIVYGQRAW